MSVIESAILTGHAPPLVTVITEPPAGVPRLTVGILLLNAGIVHRVGPGRLYVRLARRLAEIGFPVVRFDASGFGDTPVRPDNLPFDRSSVAETVEVMNDLARRARVDRFMLAGICSGAVTSFKTALVDARVSSLVLMNARGFDESREWNAYVMSHGWWRDYCQKLLSPSRWWRFLTGKTQYRRLIGVVLFRLINLVKPVKAVSKVQAGLSGEMKTLADRGVRMLLVHSHGDHGVDYLRAMMGRDASRLATEGIVEEHVIDGADHTFTRLDHQLQAVAVVERWAASLMGVAKDEHGDFNARTDRLVGAGDGT